MRRPKPLCAIGLCALVGLLGSQAAGSEKPYLLRSSLQPGQSADVELLLEAKGQIFVREGSETKDHPLALAGKLSYEERFLAAGDESLEGRRSLRRYGLAQATIQIGQQRVSQALGDDCRTIAVDRLIDQTVLHCPQTLLTREELDLLDVPGNSLLIEALLPGAALPVGQSWPVGDQVLSGLLGLDAVSASKVEGTLVAVEGTKAKIELTGTVSGAVDGVSSEIELKGKCVFDTSRGRLTWVALLVREKRSIGHVGPGLDVTARLQMKITPRETPAFLTDELAAQVAQAPLPELLQLQYTATGGGYRFAYDRRWHVISDEPGVLVMRLIDRGEMVAQCNVSAVAPKADRATTLEQFQQQVEESLGKSFKETLEAAQGETSNGLTLYRVTAAGDVEGLSVRWHYYLVTEPTGRQVVFAFTMEEPHAPRLAELDNAMVSSIEFAATGEPTTATRPAEPRH